MRMYVVSVRLLFTMKVLHGIVLLAFCTLLVAGSNHFRSDYQYHSSAQGWFKLHTAPANWEDARLRCTLEGAILASPINVDVSDAMHSIISKAGHSSSGGVYTGVHNTITPTEFDSLDGVPLSKMPVGKSKMFSQYSGSPSCMRLVPQVGLVAGSCSDNLPYLCYKKKTEELEITECGTVDRGYHLDNRTGHCYKFHRYALTWPLAYLTCVSEGGYLAVINSDTEGALLRDMLAQYPDETILGPNRGGVHSGFYDYNESRVWRTIHGDSLEVAGFAQWSPGQPDNYTPSGIGQHCGFLFRSGLLDDMQCNLTYPFICEKDPQSLRPQPHQCPIY